MSGGFKSGDLGRTHWKGTIIAGPRVPGEQSPLLQGTNEDQTLDALSGHYKIFQYKKGHRYSTDDLLVAWYGTSFAPRADRILDLGGGIGSVGMVSAWRVPGSQIVSIEAQSVSVQLAKKSVLYNGLQSRYEIREGDFRHPSVFRSGETFDLILGSPPYFPIENGIQPSHEQKVACRFEVRGSVFDYCQVVSTRLEVGGAFACVFPVYPKFQEKRVLDAASAAGLSILRRRDVILKEGESPLLGLFLMVREQDVSENLRKKTWIEPDLIIRTRDGAIFHEYSIIKMSIGFAP